jgi:hypothetical protein
VSSPPPFVDGANGRLREFTKCFPMLAAQNKEMFETVFEETRAELGKQLLVRLHQSQRVELTSRPKLLLPSKLNDLDRH